MKKYYYVAVMLSITLFSCSEERMEDIVEEKGIEDIMKQIPAQTRANTIASWDQYEKCKLSNGIQVNLPWAKTALGSVPYSVRTDVKESDGWKLLYSNVSIVGYSHKVDKQAGANYLIFYNRNTGMLKGFYFATSISENNSAFWLLTVPSSSKLFNFASYFALPGNKGGQNQISISAVTTNGITQGFELGWNCFMQELAYEPSSMTQSLDISAYALQKTKYEFSGAYNSSSSGTIVTAAQRSNNIVTGIATALGEEGKAWINRNIAGSDEANSSKAIKSTFVKSLVTNYMNQGIEGIVTLGLNKVFGSLFGVKGTSSLSKQSLQFSTNGTVKITGESVSAASGQVTPLMGIPLNGIGEPLGVWNLQEDPTYLIKSCPYLVSIPNQSLANPSFVYRVQYTPSYKIIVNPKANVTISASSSIAIYEKYAGKAPNFPEKKPGKTPVDLYNPSFFKTIYKDSETTFKDQPNGNYFDIITWGNYPNKTSISNKPAYDFANSFYDVRQHAAFKFVAKIQRNGQTLAYSCKTFIPVNDFRLNGSDRPYNWTWQDLRNNGYVK